MNEASIPLAFAFRELKYIHETLPRQDSDDACFQEIKEILKRHGLEHRYGLTLLHKHFELSDDEILVEHTDPEKRMLTSVPMKVTEVPASNLMEVTWSLATDATLSVCLIKCYYEYALTSHVKYHSVE